MKQCVIVSTQPLFNVSTPLHCLYQDWLDLREINDPISGASALVVSTCSGYRVGLQGSAGLLSAATYAKSTDLCRSFKENREFLLMVRGGSSLFAGPLSLTN